jgi:Na+/proline symporter/CheY-like chemotaxis protein/anti-sigma regulatory factor (Ser/Thr protein kinase)
MSLSAGIIALAGLVWLGFLFGIAVYGERHPHVLGRRWAIVYSLSLAVHCTSWTFYGTVTQASRSGWWLPPTFIGAILLYAFAVGVLGRMVRLAREHNASSLADLIAARLGRNSGLAAMVTAVMLLGIVPYIALQLKAVAMSYAMLRSSPQGLSTWHDSALYVALLMALFAMLFGTRRASAVAHNRGLVLAMAFESVFKLSAMLALGTLLFGAVDTAAAPPPSPEGARGFPSLILLGALAMFTLPHQFHTGVVECRDVRHLKTARWLFPLYMLLIAAPILPLARLGDTVFAGRGIPSDLYVLALPLAQGKAGLALLAFLGGLSAATSMVVVATLALSLMIANHLVAPLRVRAGWGRGAPGDLRGEVLMQRRLAILAVVLLAWGYSRVLIGNDALADIGALSFSVLAGLAPAALIAVYRPQIGARPVVAGLAVGTLVWMYTLLPTTLATDTHWFNHVLRAAERLPLLGDWSPLARAVALSLAANLAVLFLTARLGSETRETSVRATALDSSELHTLAARFLPAERVTALFALAQPNRRPDAATLSAVEHELAAVIGASSTRLLLEVAQRDRPGQLDTVAAIVGEASADLRFNQRLLEAALENMSQGICVVDAELCVVAWNRRYAELFNYPHALLAVGRPVAELTRHSIGAGVIGAGDTEDRVHRRLAHMRAGTPHLSERRFPDGSVIEIRGNPMPGGGYVATFSDVSAFRRAEQALTRANETLEQRVAERTAAQALAMREAERANETKSRFLAAVSHDLMQPLHAAQLFAHTLSAGLGVHERIVAHHLDGALAATESLLGGLLDIARLDGGRLHPQSRAFPLDELLAPLAAEFAALADERGLHLDAVATRAWVRSDPQLLRRVLQNFLGNALRHAQRGRVLLGCRRAGAELRVEVWDTGPGIEVDERQLIFEEFRRGSGATGQGLGLGLAIAARMANLLDHALTLRSWPGRGSVFAVSVPLTPAQPAAAASSESMAAQCGGVALIVDNEPLALAALKLLLESWGWRVITARDAAQALAHVEAADVAIIDYHLDGGRTGLELYTMLHEARADLASIILTADRDGALRRRIQSAGLVLLYKPLKPLALHQALLHLRSAASIQA